jgi:hypothetical protein
VTNGILLGCSLLLPVGTVNCVVTLKAAFEVQTYTEDLRDPILDSYNLDLGNGVLKLTFSETMRARSFQPEQFTLQGSKDAQSNGGDSVTLNNGCTDSNCARCAGPAGTCAVCKAPYFLHENVCIAACPATNYYEGKYTEVSLADGTVRVFRQTFTLEDAIGSHACSLEANIRVTNGIPLGSPLILPVDTVTCVQTLKVRTLGNVATCATLLVWSALVRPHRSALCAPPPKC